MYSQHNSLTTGSSAGSMNLFANIYSQQEESEIIESPENHSQKINKIIGELERATLISRCRQRNTIRTGGRKNKNEILALTLSRLIKTRHLHGTKYSREMQLAREAQVQLNNTEFILVLRTDGRIVTMSDEAEHHLGKSMRSLYAQCLNIFECLDEAEGNKLRLILTSPVDSSRHEHRLVCTLRLPKGKRPSRVNEDVKTISMAGHFYSCHDESSTTPNERLFIARCESLISTTVNRSSSTQTAPVSINNSDSIMKLTLNDDMTIQIISPNVKNILGYSDKEMCGHWFGRYLATKDVKEFESICQKYFQHDLQQEQQQQPLSVCYLFDMYTSNGEGRLTFLSQIRPIRERRRSLKFVVTAQLVDPSLRNEYVHYVQSQSVINSKPAKAEQVNLVSSAISQASEDTIMAYSPTFNNMAQLTHDGIYRHDCIHQQQFSPLDRALSVVVAPFDFNDSFGNELFDFDHTQFPTTTTDDQYWPAESTDYASFIDKSADELESFIQGFY